MIIAFAISAGLNVICIGLIVVAIIAYKLNKKGEINLKIKNN